MTTSAATGTALSAYLPWLSRHGEVYQNELGETQLTITERLPSIGYDETITHIVKEGETLFDIAVHYYKDQVDNAADCWEILAECQEEPILDGSVPLRAGQLILVPPRSYIQEIALGSSLRDSPQL